MLKDLIRERLIAAADEIFGLFERTIASYEEQLGRAREESERHRRQLEAVCKTQVLLRVHDDQRHGESSDLEHRQPHRIKEEEDEEEDEAHVSKLPLAAARAESDASEYKAPESSRRLHHQSPSGEHCGAPPPDGLLAPLSDRDCTDDESLRRDGKESNRSEKKTSLGDEKTSHVGRRHFTCSVCGKSLPNDSKLMRHLRTHTGEKPFRCSVCGKGFANKSILIRHLRTHTGEKPFRCSLCGKRFTQKPSMISHMRTHTGEKPFLCLLCGKAFTQKPHLVSHTRTHTREKPFSCSVCSGRFRHRSNLSAHMRRHETERINLLQALCCMLYIWSGSKMLKELVRERLVAAADEIFGLFEKTIASYEEQLRRAREESERHRRQLEHVYNAQVIIRLKDIQPQLESSSAEPEQPQRLGSVGAEENPQPVSTKEDATDARPTRAKEEDVVAFPPPDESGENEGEPPERLTLRGRGPSGEDGGGGAPAEPLVAPLCEEPRRSRASRRGDGARDATKTPPRPRQPFICSFCHKTFASNSILSSHLRTHAGVKPFVCLVCHRAFSRRYDLEMHQRTHTGEKPFVCLVCHRAFSRSNHLQTHMRRHTGEKPYSCSLCGANFRHHSSLKAHLRVHNAKTRKTASP
ncbi:zinc finger protein ZFP2-like [Hippocampus zosterae]|uniref:zinc finger protein ZFP2-like n=1 Tax=Hippocampus zosterae TaxID=109293 RepID=UPI00223E5412|nr:zinc finger protein ZFP2-like [Hippocampus zosterae]